MATSLWVVLLLLLTVNFAQTCSDREESVPRNDISQGQPAESADSAAMIEGQCIVGRWLVERSDGMTIGTMIFTPEGNYTLTERRLGEADVTHTGIYKMDVSTFPTTIELMFLDPDNSIDRSMETTGTLTFRSEDKIELTMWLSADTTMRFEEEIQESTVMLTRIY